MAELKKKKKRSWTMTPKRRAYLKRLREAKKKGNQVAYQPDPTPEEIAAMCAEFRKNRIEPERTKAENTFAPHLYKTADIYAASRER
mgnify:CR=1 FL=1